MLVVVAVVVVWRVLVRGSTDTTGTHWGFLIPADLRHCTLYRALRALWCAVLRYHLTVFHPGSVPWRRWRLSRRSWHPPYGGVRM